MKLTLEVGQHKITLRTQAKWVKFNTRNETAYNCRQTMVRFAWLRFTWERSLAD